MAERLQTDQSQLLLPDGDPELLLSETKVRNLNIRVEDENENKLTTAASCSMDKENIDPSLDYQNYQTGMFAGCPTSVAASLKQ